MTGHNEEESAATALTTDTPLRFRFSFRHVVKQRHAHVKGGELQLAPDRASGIPTAGVVQPAVVAGSGGQTAADRYRPIQS